MEKTAVEILSDNSEIEEFRKTILSIKGNFPFELEDMIALGEKYLEIYPDSFSERNFKHVQIGYKVVRICMLEKMITELEKETQPLIREIFNDISSIDSNIKDIIKIEGIEKTWEIYKTIFKEINLLKLYINQIPTGMIKERYTGGITSFVNIIYLIEQELLKIK